MQILNNRIFSPCISVLLLTSLAWSDSLQLRDGRHFDGQYVGGTQSTVAFFTDGSVQYFGVQDVLLVVFGGASNSNSVNPLGQSQSPMMKPMAAPTPGQTGKGTARPKARSKSAVRRNTRLLRTAGPGASIV
jgi:hypothetical protein